MDPFGKRVLLQMKLKAEFFLNLRLWLNSFSVIVCINYYALEMEPKFKCFLAAWLQGHWLMDHN